MTQLSLAALAALAVLACGCKSSNPAVPRRAGSSEVSGSGRVEAARPPAPVSAAAAREPEVVVRTVTPVVARIDNEEVDVVQLLGEWMHSDSQGVRDLLERVVSSRLVEIEAERLGISLDEELIAEEFTRTVSELESELQLSQPGMSLDDWISRGLGLDPEPYRARLLDDVRRRLLAERIVRVFVYTQEWAEVRVIVVERREEADAVLARLEAGEPFGRLANEVSLDPTGKFGGRVPPVLRNESAIARLAFGLKAGEHGGPIFESDRWMVLGLDELHAPLAGGWAEIRDEIEASLESRPIEDPEYWMWKVEMTRLHPVDFSPLLKLIGELPAAGS